jgi:hypothetical protein
MTNQIKDVSVAIDKIKLLGHKLVKEYEDALIGNAIVGIGVGKKGGKYAIAVTDRA